MKRGTLWDVAAFVGGMLAAKVAVSLGALTSVRPKQSDAAAMLALKERALGTAAIAGSSAMVIGYVGRHSEATAAFGAGIGVGAALAQHKWSRWGGA